MLAVFPTSISFLQELAENLYLSGEYVESKSVFESILILDANNETAKYYIKLYKK